MSREKLNNTVKEIAGNNAIGVNDPEIQRLCQCVNYLATQLREVAEEGVNLDSIYELAEDTLTGE